MGWSTSPDELKPFEGEITEDITLYAIWRGYRYVVLVYSPGDEEVVRIAEGEEYVCEIDSASVRGIANVTRYVPDEFITEGNNNVTDSCCEYLLPLIRGEYPVKYCDGMPVHAIIE